MWLQFAAYVKSKTRLFGESQIPNFARVPCRSFLAGAFFFFKCPVSREVISCHFLVCSIKSGVCCRPFLAGTFFFFVLRHFLKKTHLWSNKLISGLVFLKNEDIWSDFSILDLFNMVVEEDNVKQQKNVPARNAAQQTPDLGENNKI